jgi:hypothetical protein
MIGMLVVLTLFFFVASLYQLKVLHGEMTKVSSIDLSPALSMLEMGELNISDKDKMDAAIWKTLSILEGNALQRRYHQANAILMSRIWTRYLGFVTGMTLALVGAAFVLGKLREPESTLDVEGTSIGKLSIASASPGLTLAFLGTVLMVTTIVVHNKIEVRDTPSFTSLWFSRLPAKETTIETEIPAAEIENFLSPYERVFDQQEDTTITGAGPSGVVGGDSTTEKPSNSFIPPKYQPNSH